MQPLGCMKVEREITIDADRAAVWAALTDPLLLAEWAAGEVDLFEPEPGGRALFRFEDGEERRATVDTVEELERLAFRWRRDGRGESHVEFRLEAIGRELTRLTVVETGPVASAAWWGPRLELLASNAARLVLA